MPLRWPGHDLALVFGGEITLLPRDKPFVVPPGSEGAAIQFQQVTPERLYQLGDHIALDAWDLSEIVFFYQLLAMRVSSELHQVTARLGRMLQ